MGSSATFDVLIVGAGMTGLTAGLTFPKLVYRYLFVKKKRLRGDWSIRLYTKALCLMGGIRGIEDSGIVSPMLKQLG